MAYSYEEVLSAQATRIDDEQAEAVALLESARRAEDAGSVNLWADKILELDAKRQHLFERARAYAQPAQAREMPGAEDLSRADAALAAKYRLSAGDLAIAKNWTTAGDLTEEQKVATYVQNVNRLREERASGRYRDDRGRVTR
jgi:hypothetical protein